MADAHDSLRRIRSAGDMPVSPTIQPSQPALFQPSRYSESHVQSPNQPIHHASPTLSTITVPPAVAQGPRSAGLAIERPESTASPVLPVALPPPPVPQAAPPLADHNVSSYTRIMTFFGYGRGASRARKLLVSLWYNLAWGFVQVCGLCGIEVETNAGCR